MYSILLVEDEELELETLRDYIDWESLECSPVYAVHSARRALEAVRRWPVFWDFILI